MASPSAWTDATRERTISRRLDCVGRQLMFLPAQIDDGQGVFQRFRPIAKRRTVPGDDGAAGVTWRAAGEDDHFIAVGKQAAGKGLAHEPAAAGQNDPFGSHSEG